MKNKKDRKKDEVFDDFTLEVRKIENDAKKIVEDSEKKKEEILNSAKNDSVTLLEKKQKGLEKKRDQKIERGKKKVDKKREEIIEEGEKEIISLEKKSRKKIPEAKKFVFKKLEQRMEEL